MQIHYLEIVTPEIDSACLNYEAVHGIRFGAGEESGGEIAHPPLEIAGHGKFAIYIMGGNNHGLWQV